MREIKFRGKRVDNGEWVYGYYYHDQRFKNGHSCQDVYIIRDELDQDFEVGPATVGQFTKLRGIYEGDIVWFWVSESDPKELLIDVLMGIEVIGNIHDNPEYRPVLFYVKTVQ